MTKRPFYVLRGGIFSNYTPHSLFVFGSIALKEIICLSLSG